MNENDKYHISVIYKESYFGLEIEELLYIINNAIRGNKNKYITIYTCTDLIKGMQLLIYCCEDYRTFENIQSIKDEFLPCEELNKAEFIEKFGSELTYIYGEKVSLINRIQIKTK